jgi:hypothetical protein
MEKYGLGYLEDRFYEDALKVRNEREERIAIFKAQQGDAKMPEWIENEFNFALAMHTLMSEIIRLRRDLDELRKERAIPF